MRIHLPKAVILPALLFMATACSKDKSVCAGKQSEAQANLIGIATHQEQYREQHGRFADPRWTPPIRPPETANVSVSKGAPGKSRTCGQWFRKPPQTISQALGIACFSLQLREAGA